MCWDWDEGEGKQTIARLLLFNLSVSGAVLLVEIQKPCQNWLQTQYNQGLLTQLEFCWAGISIVVLFPYNKGWLRQQFDCM